jgi:hypothetical protein
MKVSVVWGKLPVGPRVCFYENYWESVSAWKEKFTNTLKDAFCVVSRREVFPFLRTLHLSSCGSRWTGVIRKSLGLEELKDFLRKM